MKQSVTTPSLAVVRIALLRPLMLLLLSCPALSLRAENALLIPVESGMRLIRVEAPGEEGSDWKVVAVAHLDGQAGTVKVRLPEGLTRDQLKITASAEPMFPESFTRSRETVTTTRTYREDGFVSFMPATGRWLDSDTTALAEMDEEIGTATEDVQESDIWRLSGDTLYFYNHARGLQIYDLSDPDHPIRLGALEFAGRGQQMYVLNDDYAVLIADAPAPEMVVVRVNDGDPRIVARHRLSGDSYLESRLVGRRLYLASQTYVYSEGTEANYHITIEGFDLTSPESPGALQPLTLYGDNGWGTILTATPEHMILSVGKTTYSELDTTWWRRGWRQYSEISLIDLTAADGSPVLVDTVDFDGYIGDKHKLAFENGVLTAIGQAESYRPLQNRWGRNSLLETFTLSDGKLSRAGTLQIAPEETLYATLIDGDRAYVVTFLQIDPLFVIDLSDPVSPTILGELDVPGFSNVLKLLDERRLFSVGVEGRRVAASLFAVDDPSQLKLLSRVYIGAEGTSSWSEANYDDRAVTILPEANLALLPFARNSFGESSGIQIFSFEGDTIRARGQIEHDQWARRAGMLDDATLVSISESELFTIDISDPDTPTLLAEETLSWYANRLFRIGDYLLQFDTTSSLLAPGITLYVSSVAETDVPLASFKLPEVAPLGFAQNGSWIYLASVQAADGNPSGSVENPQLEVLALDCSNPLAPTVGEVASLALENINDIFQLQLNPHWIDPHTLLWVNADQASRSVDDFLMNSRHIGSAPLEDTFLAIDFAFWPYAYDQTPFFLSVSVADPAAPAILDTAFLPAQDEAFSRQRSSIFIDGKTAFFTLQDRSHGYFAVEGENGDPEYVYQWVLANHLYSLDFSTPDNLVFGEPLEIDGHLEGISSVGEGAHLAFTAETISTYDGNYTVQTQDRVRAYTFDGAQLLRIDDYDWHLPAAAFLPSHLETFGLTLLRPLVTTVNSGEEPRVERLALSPDGTFESLTPLPVESANIESSGRIGPHLFTFANDLTTVWDLTTDTPAGETFEGVFPAPARFSADRVVYREGEQIQLAHDYFGVLTLPLMPPPGRSDGSPGETPDSSTDQFYWETIEAGTTTLTSIVGDDSVGRLGSLRWRFRPASQSSPDATAQDWGEGWYESPWYGWFYLSESASWAYHLEHGWSYTHAIAGGAWVHDSKLGWTWVASSAYPAVYSTARGSWLYYLRGSGEGGKRWFYDYAPAVQDWITVDRS